MIARYVSYLDNSSEAAFLWSRMHGIRHANAAAAQWTKDPAASEMLSAAAKLSAESQRAEIYVVRTTEFLLLPLIDPQNNTDYVIGIANATLGDVLRILHDLDEDLRYLSQTMHLLPLAVLTATPEGLFDYATRRWYEIIGKPADESNVEESLHDAAGSNQAFFERSWSRGVDSGEPFAFEIPLQTAQGLRWFEIRATPSYEGTQLRKWIVTTDDVHERVELRNELARVRARLAALAEIGAVALDRTLSEKRRVERAFQSAAKALDGIWAATITIGGRKTLCIYPLDAKLPDAFFDSRSVLGVVASAEGWFEEQPRSVLRVPFNSGESGEDQLAVVGAVGREAFDQLDIDFIREVAWRIAGTFRSANASRRESRIARVLQAAMLPVALPRVLDVAFDVAYIPAETEMLIGGDWYDVFELRDGRVAFSVGDVAGHGLDAAVVMGHVRDIIRTLSQSRASPAEVLEETNRAVSSSNYGLISAVLAYLDPEPLVMEYSIAGHPVPLCVLPDGTLEPLEYGDVILGAAPRARFRTRSMRLKRECALVLYTDGLVEYARDAVAGELRLREVLSEWARTGFKAGANELAQRIFEDASAADDTAMLIVRLQQGFVDGYESERRMPARSAADSRS